MDSNNPSQNANWFFIFVIIVLFSLSDGSGLDIIQQLKTILSPKSLQCSYKNRNTSKLEDYRVVWCTDHICLGFQGFTSKTVFERNLEKLRKSLGVIWGEPAWVTKNVWQHKDAPLKI